MTPRKIMNNIRIALGFGFVFVSLLQRFCFDRKMFKLKT